MYGRWIKRLLDIVLALCILVALSPLYLVVALVVYFRLGSPVLFRQERPGLHEKVFAMYKFRSMTDARDEQGNLLPDIVRLTPLGKFLRKTSLDELPEIFNVLRGDMSFIGPRPLLKEYLPYYTEEERLRHSVRPGITGLAQVNGRNLLNWDKRLALDVEYAKNLSFAMDVLVFFKTFAVVFGHTEEVAEDTAQAEGNFAEIRRQMNGNNE